MICGQTSPISRHEIPQAWSRKLPLKNQGHRECRMPIAPTASCAKQKKHTSKVTTGSTGFNPAFPARMVLTVSFALSPVIGLFVTVVARIVPRDVASASRRQDHTTSPSAIGAFVVCAARVHRIHTYVRDDRKTALFY